MVTDSSSAVEDTNSDSEASERGDVEAETALTDGETATESADERNGADGTEAGTELETGLEPNVAGALSYLLGPVTGILFYVLEPEDAFVRFHAAQSTIVFGGLFAASIVLSTVLAVLAVIPVVGWIAAAALGVGSLVLAPVSLVAWAFLMYKAYAGEEYEVPLVAPYARRFAESA